MKFRFELTEQITEFISNASLTEISIGCSDSQVVKIEKENKCYFLKIAKAGILTSEYEKLKWLEGKIKVPKIIIYENKNEIEYLVTESLLGEMVCSDYYLENPMLGIPIVVEAFKDIYKVDISDCPFNVALDYKLELVKSNVFNNLLDINNISEEVLKEFGSPENIYNYLVENRFEEELVFSHGDVSLPNLFTNNNSFSGFIDVGECGIADKWFDIAIAVKSIKRNFGDDAVIEFYKQLGIVEDSFKVNYYLLLMELYL